LRGKERPHYSVRLITVVLISAIFVLPSLTSRQPSIITSTSGVQTGASSTASTVKVDSQLQQLIDKHVSGDVKVIVTLRDGVDMASVRRVVGADQSLRIITTFSILPAVLIEGPANKIKDLESVTEIRSLYLNKEYLIIPINGTSNAPALASLTPSWTSVINATPPSIADGSGIKVAVADSGIDATHPDLFGKVIAANSFVRTIYGYTSDDLVTDDGFGHGTYVAGIIAGSGALQPEYRGVAPQAQLINSKCIDAFGRGFTAGIIKAIEYAVNMSADVINLSLGGSPADPDDPLSLAADSAARSGTVVVAAAGNEGPNYSTGDIPAAARLAISVGAYNTSSSIASFSSRGPTLDGRPFPDLVAPGVDVTSTLASSSSFYDYATRLGLTDGYYITLGGTSAATPFVSGAAALLLSAVGLTQLNRFNLPPQSRIEIPTTIRIALMKTAKSLGGDVNTQGSGLIDVYSAYVYLLNFGARLPYPIVEVYPKALVNPPYFIGFLGESLHVSVSILTALKANLTVSVSGNASFFINLGNTTFTNAVGLTTLGVNISIPVNARLGRYNAQIGFENTTTHSLLLGQNVSVSFDIRVPLGRLYFDLFHTDSSFSIVSDLYEIATLLRSRGYSVYEGDEPISYRKISGYDAVVLTDPIIMYGLEEVNALQRFVDNNGSLLVLGTYYPNIVTESINKITSKYGIQFDKNLIANYSDVVFANALNSLINITSFYGHPITSGLTGYLYGYGSTLSISSPATIASSTPSQFGNLTALAASDLPNGGRIVAAGSLLFATDEYLTSSSYPGNLKLVENIFDWLLGKTNITVETITPNSRVGAGEPFQIGITVSNKTSGSLLDSTVSCTANNGSTIPIQLKSDAIGIQYNMSIELQTEGFYKFNVDVKVNPSGPSFTRSFYIEVVNSQPKISNVTLSAYNNPAYQGQLPTIYRSFLPDGTPIILRHGDYVNFTIEVSGLTQPNSNVTIYLTRSPTFYLANNKPLTYVSLTATKISSTVYHATYEPSISNTTDVYLYWISANNAGHISSYNNVGYILVGAIDPLIDNLTTTINSHPLSDLRTPEGQYLLLYPITVGTGSTISFVINGTDAEDTISNMRAYAVLIDPSLYVVPGLLSSELMVAQIPYDSAAHCFRGNLTIPESGFVTIQGEQSIQLSLVNTPSPFYILIVLVDSDGAYSTDFAGVYILESRQPLFSVVEIFAILAVCIAVPVLIIYGLGRRGKRDSEAPQPVYYDSAQPAATSFF
jgi:hypothetical protein